MGFDALRADGESAASTAVETGELKLSWCESLAGMLPLEMLEYAGVSLVAQRALDSHG